MGAEWGPDPDGDYPVDVKLVDRTRYEPDHYSPVRYEHECVSDVDREERLYQLLGNVKTACDRLDTEVRVRKLRRPDERDGPLATRKS